MLVKTIVIYGFNILIYDFGYAKYMCPEFNGNAEFKVNKKGFKRLSSYLRTVLWIESLFSKII